MDGTARSASGTRTGTTRAERRGSRRARVRGARGLQDLARPIGPSRLASLLRSESEGRNSEGIRCDLHATAVPLFETRDLAIYASIIGTLDGAWTIYNGAIRDRPRIVVKAARGEAVPTDGSIRAPIFLVTVSNRGRRPVNIEHIGRFDKLVRGTSIVTPDFMQQLAAKPRLEESQSRTFVHGQMGGYEHGDLPESRWYVVDGAGRIHPLRERYRQGLLAFVLRPVRRFLARKGRT